MLTRATGQAFYEEGSEEMLLEEWICASQILPLPPPTPEGFVQVDARQDARAIQPAEPVSPPDACRVQLSPLSPWCSACRLATSLRSSTKVAGGRSSLCGRPASLAAQCSTRCVR